MVFQPGDRVVVMRHADWKRDVAATVVGPCPARTVDLSDGSRCRLYWVEFDEPQRDLADWMQETGQTFVKCTVQEPFLQPME